MSYIYPTNNIQRLKNDAIDLLVAAAIPAALLALRKGTAADNLTGAAAFLGSIQVIRLVCFPEHQSPQSKERFKRYLEALKQLDQPKTKKSDVALPYVRDIRASSDTPSELLKKTAVIEAGNTLAKERKNYYFGVLKIFEHCESQGYWAFLHGQSIRWMIVCDLIKAFVRVKNPSKDLSQFHFFRDPNQFTNQSPNVNWFVKNITDTSNKIDGFYRKHLLSVDISPVNQCEYDSALYFFREGRSCLDKFENIRKAAFKVIDAHITQRQAIKKAQKKIRKLLSDYKTDKTGCLYVIAVPKDKLDKIGYAAHQRGVACTHFSPQHPGWTKWDKEKVLGAIQKGSLSHQCELAKNRRFFPQYRLLTHELTHENGIRTFRTSTLPKNDRLHIKKAVAQIAALSLL